MKIIVLDGHAMNPGDLSWEDLKNLGDVNIYERTSQDQILERAFEADALVVNKILLTEAILEQLPKLKYVGVTATGVNNVDLVAAKKLGIAVTNIPAYSTQSVAQMVFALILELTQRVGHHSDAVRLGKWSLKPDFCFWDHQLIELDNLTMGLLGYGAIAKATAKLAHAFGMNVLVHTRTPQKDSEGLRFVNLETVLKTSDIVSLHCPLSDSTKEIINSDRVRLMKKTAILINTGRGALIDESALAYALNSGQLAGAGLDVLSVEPPSATNPLLSAQNCLITPHIAWATTAARKRLLKITVNNMEQFIKDQPKNLVN